MIAGPRQYKGQGAIKHELAVVKAGIAEAGAQVEDFFFPVLGPGWLGHFLFNEYYPTEEEYVYAMAAMFRGEYEAVVEAGFTLQIDDPGLADKFGMFYPPITIEAFRKHAELRIEATNWALRNIPEDRVRYHTCWGSWHTPHTTDIPFKRIVDLMLKVKAQAYSVEAADVRHELEAIRKQFLPKDELCWIVGAFPLCRGVRDDVGRSPVSEEVSLGSDGRAMGDRGTDAPARQAEHTRRSPAHSGHEGSPQHDSLFEPEWLPMGYAATRFAAQEYGL